MNRSVSKRVGVSLAAVSLLLLLAALAAPAAHGQLPTVQPVPAWKQVPSGEGACSVGKSCAELAPQLIRSAMGPSPLEENIGALAGIGPRVPGSPAAGRATKWAAEAFRRAGAQDVRTEPAGQNVVAEIRGYEKPDEFVVIGAPLDSAESPEASLAGAYAVGVAIDAFRVIHSSGSIPRRSIRFVLFTGGAQGSSGGEAYVRAHRTALDGMMAAVFFEPGTGAIHGYSLDGRGDALAAVRKALEPSASLGVKEFTVDAVLGANNLDFLLAGIPTLVARQETGDPAGGGTSAALPELKRHVAIAAITAYGLADADRIAPRQSRAEIEQLLKKTGLDAQMKAAGIWSAWETGQRGRRP